MTDSAQRSRQMALIESFEHVRILCVGDVMLDRFISGDVTRISPEAPIPVMKRTGEQRMLGGAGNVVRNIVSLGAECDFISVIGSDTNGDVLRELVTGNERLHANLIEDPSRRSSEKIRFVCDAQQLLRCDDEDSQALSDEIERAVLSAFDTALPGCQLVVLSDYAKGVLTERVIRHIIDRACEHEIPVFIDPKRADAALYAGASLLSPNLGEMQAFLPGTAPVTAAQTLCRSHHIAAIALTRGKDGLSLIQPDLVEDFPAEPREVYDVSGAGDTVIATLAVATAAGASLREASELANLAAGIAVSRPGTAAVYRTDLKAALHHADRQRAAGKLVPLDMAIAITESWRTEGLRIGLTNGCFDLLHVGHLQSLQAARSHCDRLIVAINNDASVRRLKGESRPVNGEMDRADLLGGLSCVDLVIIFREDTPEALLEKLRPDVLMKGADYTKDQVVGASLVEAYGGEIKLLAIKDGYSSSMLIEKSKNVS